MKKGNKDIFRYNKEDFQIEIFDLSELSKYDFPNYQRYNFHQVVWFTKSLGNKSYSIDFNKHEIEDNQLVIIYPRQIERVDLIGKEGFLFAINNDVFFEISLKINSNYLNGYFSNVFVSLDTQVSDCLNRISALMIDEYQNLNRPLLIESYMQAFLCHIAFLESGSKHTNNRNVSLFIELVKLVDRHFIDSREVVFYANRLNVSEKKLNTVCKTLLGKTTKQFIQERLILEIKKEIKLGTKSLKEIAFDLGFSESAYFTRFFKQQTSMLPSEFKDDN